eukprot:m.45397 g.45397  ORF g.45397 m.45397 type:complete len:388 (-) comp5878_c0_seq1:133-1296(-)
MSDTENAVASVAEDEALATEQLAAAVEQLQVVAEAPTPGTAAAEQEEDPVDNVETILQETLSKDRLLLLKLSSAIDAFFNSPDEMFTLGPMEPYQRKVCHNAATLYQLDHFLDPSGQAVIFRKTASSQYNPRLRDLLVPGEAVAAPARVIIARRGPGGAGSAAAPRRDDQGASDLPKNAESIEEKERRYREIRDRIFGDFVPKEDPAPAPAPAAPTPEPVEPLMQFPEIRANRAPPPRARPQPAWTPPMYIPDTGAGGFGLWRDRPAERPSSAYSTASRVPVAPLLQVGSASHVWGAPTVYPEVYYQQAPLVQAEVRPYPMPQPYMQQPHYTYPQQPSYYQAPVRGNPLYLPRRDVQPGYQASPYAHDPRVPVRRDGSEMYGYPQWH